MRKLGTIRHRDPLPRKVSSDLNNSRWRRFRSALLNKRRIYCAHQDAALCVDCEIEGRPYGLLSVQAHHILSRATRPDLKMDPRNIEFVCIPHHNRRTEHEQVIKVPNRWVVYGLPGVGKTTLVEQCASDGAKIWDADVAAEKRGMGIYPRSPGDAAKLDTMREAFIRQAARGDRETWVIVRWPRTAYRIARLLRANIIALTEATRDSGILYDVLPSQLPQERK